jgi:hypothetical protein
MAVLNDTTSKTINGKDGTADFQIKPFGETDSTSYKCILDMFRVREVIEMTNADVFCIEGTADQEPGRSQIVGEASGIGKKGGIAAGPLIPAPQNADLVLQFSTACTLTFTSNFTEASADRTVNQNMRIGFRFLSKKAYVLAWDLGEA